MATIFYPSSSAQLFSFVNHTLRKSSFERGEETCRVITHLSACSVAKTSCSHCFLLFIGKKHWKKNYVYHCFFRVQRAKNERKPYNHDTGNKPTTTTMTDEREKNNREQRSDPNEHTQARSLFCLTFYLEIIERLEKFVSLTGQRFQLFTVHLPIKLNRHRQYLINARRVSLLPSNIRVAASFL